MAVYQGTLATIRRQVLNKLRLDETLDSADVDIWINLTYLDVVQRTESLQRTASSAMTLDVGSYVMPSEIFIIKRLDILYADGTISKPMKEVTLENILSIRQDDSQVPQRVYQPVYALTGESKIEIWPNADAGQSLRFHYVYKPDKLTADADVPLISEPFGSKILEFGACVEGARFKKDNLLSDYEQAYEYWVGRYTSYLNRSNIIHQFPVLETGSQIPADPSADYAFNWR